MQRADRLLVRLERGLMLLLFALLGAAQLAAVVLRNLGRPSSATFFALSPALMLGLSLTGASLALREERHIRISLLHRWLPSSSQRWTAAGGDILCLAVSALLLVVSCGFVVTETTLFGPRRAVVFVYPLFFVLLSIRLLLRLLGRLAAPATAPAERGEPP